MNLRLRAIYFSDLFMPFAIRIKFLIIIYVRFLVILFRKNKSITEVKFDYSKKYIFENSYFLIEYNFKNALWFEFQGLTKTTNDNIIIFNSKNIEEKQFDFIVHGFFRKRKYQIDATHTHRFESKSFLISTERINIQNLIFPNPRILTNDARLIAPVPIIIAIKGILNIQKPTIISTKPIIDRLNPLLTPASLLINNNKPQVVHSKFNQTEFI